MARPAALDHQVATGMIDFVRGNAGWLAAGGLLTLMSSFGQTFFISIFAGEIRAAFGLSHGAWGGIYTLGTALSAAVMIWAGVLTDRFRVRRLGPWVLIGLACACVAMAANSHAALLPLIIFALRFFGQGMTSHVAIVAMSRWFVATRGRALSIAALGFSLGEMVLPVSFVALMVYMDWRLLWLVAAAICLGAVPILMRLLKQERTPQSIAREQGTVGMDGSNWRRSQAMRHYLFWFMVPALLGPAAFNTAFFFHQVHFATLKGWQHIELVVLFPVYTTVAVVAMFLSGWALDRLGTARLIPFFQLPMVGAFIAFAVADATAMALVGFVLLALTTGANSTLPNAFWAEFYGTAHIGAIKAMAAAVMVLGSAIGPGITGALIDLGYGLETQFLWIAGYFVLTSVLMGIGVGAAARRLASPA